MTEKILVIGAGGQIGSELTLSLRQRFGTLQVIASDINTNNSELALAGPFEILDAEHYDSILHCVKKHNINTIYLMAALLSATAEKAPDKAWNLNTNSLFNVLNLARDGFIKKIFWPSSIAVFGPTTPKINTPQTTVMEPTTVYGITKLVGERWCAYYHKTFGVDVRSLRYPGIISWKTLPGGGTTDYAVDIFHKALTQGHYTCFLNENTRLPMMYMDDAIKATITLMTVDAKNIKTRSSYNLAAISFTPKDMAKAIKKHLPEFTMSYLPDYRQAIADSWPQSIDDLEARTDWNWKHRFNLEYITEDMILHLQETHNQ